MSARSGPGDLAEAERGLRRTVALAALLWLAVYLVRAVVSLGEVRAPLAYAAGLAVWVGGSLLALRPLVRRLDPARERRETVVVALSLPAAGLLDAAATRPDALDTPANWVLAGCLVPIAALVLRGSDRLAVAGGAALVAVQAAVVVVEGSPAGDVAALWVLVALWVLGAVAVRRHQVRTREHGLALRARRASAATDRLVDERWGRLRLRHYRDLEEEVLPLLRRVAALPEGASVSEGDRRAALAAADTMRDALPARTLVDTALRERVRAARADGVRVVLHSSLPDGPAVAALRVLVARLLDVPGVTTLTVRTFSEPVEASVVVRLADGFVAGEADAVRARVGEDVPGWASWSVHDLDGVVMVRLRGEEPG